MPDSRHPEPLSRTRDTACEVVPMDTAAIEAVTRLIEAANASPEPIQQAAGRFLEAWLSPLIIVNEPAKGCET